MQKKINSPGIKRSGWNTDDFQEQITGAMEEIKFCLGELSETQKGSLQAILSTYFVSVDADTGTDLKDTRGEIDGIHNMCSELSRALSQMMKNPSSKKTLKKAGAKIDLTIIDVIPKLRRIKGCCLEAAKFLPEKGRWDQVIPARDLVKALARFYEDYAHRPAKKDIHQDRTAKPEEKYSGPFFELILTVYYLFNFKELSNSSLGKFIYDSLSHTEN